MRLADLNALDDEAAADAFLRCCGSSRWARQMAAARPFADADGDGRRRPIASGSALEAADWLEAFAAHPKIGAGRAGQAGSAGAGGTGRRAGRTGPSRSRPASRARPMQTLRRLAEANRDYEARFGYIFIVCATGKTADEMLALLEARLRHDAGEELRDRGGGAAEDHAASAAEAARTGAGHHFMITTHVLDIARGEPAEGITVILELRQASEWTPIGRGTTDEKGRVNTLTDGPVSPGHLPADVRHRLVSSQSGPERGVLPRSADHLQRPRSGRALPHSRCCSARSGTATYRGA